ncbi:MAG: hypothetical protein JXA96_15270 [Sedimentisphaerales bacterium]|nr:hypothetical protein [Sedimentisphaerales bacterium]
MAIVFHCQFCNKEIRASDEAGGKWGKCPKCHNKIYVPSIDPEKEEPELKLAPVDEDEIQRKRELMAETYRIQRDILEEREVPNNLVEPSVGTSGTMRKMSNEELEKYVIMFLRQMAAGELDDSERTSKLLSPYGKQVKDIIDRIALSEIPEPKLAHISPNVLSGFIRTLRSKIR